MRNFVTCKHFIKNNRIKDIWFMFSIIYNKSNLFIDNLKYKNLSGNKKIVDALRNSSAYSRLSN